MPVKTVSSALRQWQTLGISVPLHGLIIEYNNSVDNRLDMKEQVFNVTRTYRAPVVNE